MFGPIIGLVLNLVINGWPSIRSWLDASVLRTRKWVLNLVINGWPSILGYIKSGFKWIKKVLNLVINGWPSIPCNISILGFLSNISVLNLVINGWPSILKTSSGIKTIYVKVLNLVINGWPSILINLR